MSKQNKSLAERLADAKKDSPLNDLDHRHIVNTIHNEQQRLNGATLTSKEREQLSIRNTEHVKKGWNLNEEERTQRIEAVRQGLWGDEEKRKTQGEKISKGKIKNHPTRGKPTPKNIKDNISKNLLGRKKPQYGQVISTPNGIFETRNDVAKEYNVKPDTVSKWINKGTGPGKFEWVKKK